MILRVRDWDTHFENNRTRGMREMQWVPITNRMDGEGYTALMEHKNGAAHLGCWVAIVQIASKCEPRGALIKRDGTPHDYKSLSRICRIPERTLRAAVEILLSPQVGWLEYVELTNINLRDSRTQPAPSPHPGGTLLTPSPHPTDDARAHTRGTERKKERTERTERTEPHEPADKIFERCYSESVVKQQRGIAERNFVEAVVAGADPVLIESRWKATNSAWREDRFLKKQHFAEWLLDGNWRYPAPGEVELESGSASKPEFFIDPSGSFTRRLKPGETVDQNGYIIPAKETA